MRRSVWGTLDIQPTSDTTAIRRAYAARLKQVHPEDDPDAFQELRAAYEQALNFAAHRTATPDPEPQSPPSSLAWSEGETDHEAEPATPGPSDIPGVTADEISELQSAFNRLQALVETGNAGDADEIVRLFRIALRSPALEAVVIREQAEAWIASTILDSAPRADMLIEPAADAFGWSDDTIGSEGTLIGAVLHHRRGVEFVARLSNRHSPHRDAYRALTKPPVGMRLWQNRMTPGLSGKVRALLTGAAGDALHGRLDPDAYHWWAARLNRRRHWVEWLVLAALSAILIGVFVSAVGVNGDQALLWASGAVILTGIGVALIFGKAHTALAERRPSPLLALARFGWVGLAMGALIAAALPPSLLLVIGLAAAGLVSLLWAAGFGVPDRGAEGVFRLLLFWVIPINLKPSREGSIAISLLPLVLFGCALFSDLPPEPRWGQVNLGLFVAGAALTIGHQQLRWAWLAGPRPLRLTVLVLLILATAAMPWLLWATAPTSAFTAAAALAVGGLMLAHIVLLPETTGLMARTVVANVGWLPISVVGSTVVDATGQGNGVLLFGGLWILAIVAAGLIGAFRETVLEGRRKRRPAA